MKGDIKEAVILCAGRSTRTYPMTLRKPKPMLKIANRRIIEHLLMQLQGLVERVVIVIGFEGQQLVRALGKRFNDVQITYVEQKEQRGTGDALLTAQNHLSERFLMLNGDDLLKRAAIELLLRHELCVLASPHPQPWRFGVLMTEGEFVKAILEKPKDAPPNSIVSTGAYALTGAVFEMLRRIQPIDGREVMFTDIIPMLSSLGLRYEVTNDGWMPVTYPWDILLCTDWLMSEMYGRNIGGHIGSNVKLIGPIEMGSNCYVGSGAIIHGPCKLGDSVNIGERTIVRSCAIGDNVTIGHGCELNGCVIYDGARIGNNVRLKRSVVGDGVKICDGVSTLSETESGVTVTSVIKGEAVDTGLKEVGAFIGDGAFIGEGCKLMAGVKVWAEAYIPPYCTVEADVIEG
ncbi:MAG: sugar phosphate nucleotidyltransferase [Armatimonadota bacterium]|nr:sugar phosphate nucleotidyltransferase [Armatimonadota bacterium]MCX7776476.1 sugar phosphate nucleotidyltransferase [Armatimonadota bacterium]MDW8024273.1 sugar phosphate nucleotidyltransferase [Armatimonadota bacterium]